MSERRFRLAGDKTAKELDGSHADPSSFLGKGRRSLAQSTKISVRGIGRPRLPCRSSRR